MSKDTLTQWIIWYGKDTSKWPLDIQQQLAQLLQNSPSMQQVLDDEIDFYNHYTSCFNAEPSSDFINRITDAAFSKPQTTQHSLLTSLQRYIRTLMQELHIPAPVTTFASIALLGIALGFGYSSIVEHNDYIIPNISLIYDTRDIL
tara:strand:- start:408 stop:845 length:438 start_codon:yes stop_codon:yes gene_type:complete